MPPDPGYASLCVLSYQRPNFLSAMLQSIMDESDYPFELIVHDDGSTDTEVGGVLREYDDVIATTILNRPGHNQGVGEAIRKCFNVATGGTRFKLDQDLTFRPGWLRKAMDTLASAPQPPQGEYIILRDAQGTPLGATLVDVEDYQELSTYRWGRHSRGYAARHDRELGTVLMHRQIMGEGGIELLVDHRNRRRLDNRRSNLRWVTRGENQHNYGQSKRGTSRFRGVSWNAKEKKWYGFVKLDGKQQFMGGYDDEREAAEACEEWRSKHMPTAQPDPELVPDPPPIGLLGMLRYEHEPVDYRKTLIADYGTWQHHTHILGSAFAVTEQAWRAYGDLDTHSEAFAEDWVRMKQLTDDGLFACALPSEDLADNHGFGIGPSTVVVADGTVAKIHKRPFVFPEDWDKETGP